MEKEEFNQLNFESKSLLFNQGVQVGTRTIVNGKLSWCRQINDFYIIKTLDWGNKREFIAFKNTTMIEPFLNDVELPDIFEIRK